MFWPHFITSMKNIPSERKKYICGVYAWGQKVRMYPPAGVLLWTAIHTRKRISAWLGLWASVEQKPLNWSEVPAENVRGLNLPVQGRIGKCLMLLGCWHQGAPVAAGWVDQSEAEGLDGSLQRSKLEPWEPPGSKHQNHIKGAGSGGQRSQPQWWCAEQVNPTKCVKERREHKWRREGVGVWSRGMEGSWLFSELSHSNP